MKGKFLSTFFALCLPFSVSAEVWITEIHYNPESTDSGYEWIELYNNSSNTINLGDYKLHENNVRHGLKEFQGNLEIPKKSFLVVADNPVKFLERFPGYNDSIIDSAFSLSNTGETLQLLDSQLSVIFEVTYNKETGGDGNGHSVGLIDSIWQEVVASPGAANVSSPVAIVEPDEVIAEKEELAEVATVPTAQVTPTYIEIKNPEYSEKLIKVDAGSDRTVMAGVDYWFSGKVYGLQGGKIDDPTVRWNWGDGTTGAGISDTQRYLYPGEYTVTMSASVSKYSARDRVVVRVIPPSLDLGMIADELGQYIVTLTNTSQHTLEVSGYVVRIQEIEFVFPEDTFINAGQELVLHPDNTALHLDNTSSAILEDGNGHLISTLQVAEQLLRQQVASESAADVPLQVDKKLQDVQAQEATHSVVYISNSKDIVDSAIIDNTINVMETNAGLLNEKETVLSFQQANMIDSLEQADSILAWRHILALVVVSILGAWLYHSQRKKEREQEQSRLETNIEIVE